MGDRGWGGEGAKQRYEEMGSLGQHSWWAKTYNYGTAQALYHGCQHWRPLLKEDTIVETKATLRVARARLKRVLTYSKIETAALCS